MSKKISEKQLASSSRVSRPYVIGFFFEKEERTIRLKTRGSLLEKIGLIAFFSVWLSGWTVGCVLIFIGALNDPFMFLFGIPFWASWFAVVGLLLFTFFGFSRLHLGPEGVVSETVVFFPFTHREAPVEKIDRFEISGAKSKIKKDSSAPITVMAIGPIKKISFPCNTEAEAIWVVQELNELLRELNGNLKSAKNRRESDDYIALEDEGTDEDAENENSKQPIIIPLHSRMQDLERPNDCRWSMVSEFDAVRFRRRDTLLLLMFPLFLFINLFWNGIVAVFLAQLWGFGPQEAQPEGAEWWFLFFFLIPFQIIGLGMFWGLLGCLLGPFKVYEWSLERGVLMSRTSFFGIGHWKTYMIDDCKEMRIAPDKPPAKKWYQTAKSEESESSFDEYAISFFDSRDEEICTIHSLESEEAEWMADMILKHR